MPGVGDVGTVVECAKKYRTDPNADVVIIPYQPYQRDTPAPPPVP